MRRCFPRRRGRGHFARGEWAGLPQSYDFILGFRRELPIFSRRVRKLWGFGGGQRSGCGRESGWILGDFSRGRWSISVIVSAFFMGFLGEGGRRWACARVASGAGDEKRCIRQHTRCGMHRKRGSWGGNPSKTCPQLVGEWVPLSAWGEG